MSFDPNAYNPNNVQQPSRNASILGGVTQGMPQGQQAGSRIIVFGLEKMGKTTFAMGAPNALLIPTELDSPAMSRYRHTKIIQSWSEVEQLCVELIEAAKQGQLARGSSLVWDSLTAIERFIHLAVLMEDPQYVKAYDHATGVLKPNMKAVTMESALGGYGKAYSRANEHFQTFTRYMDELAFYGGINVVMTCHAFASRVKDPAHGEYDTWDLLLHSPKNDKTYGKRELATQWADVVGFLYEPMFITKADDNGQLQRGITANMGRSLAISRAPQWVAGNRYQLNGSIPIPEVGGFNYFADAVYNSTRGVVDLYNRASPPFEQ